MQHRRYAPATNVDMNSQICQVTQYIGDILKPYGFTLDVDAIGGLGQIKLSSPVFKESTDTFLSIELKTGFFNLFGEYSESLNMLFVSNPQIICKENAHEPYNVFAIDLDKLGSVAMRILGVLDKIAMTKSVDDIKDSGKTLDKLINQ